MILIVYCCPCGFMNSINNDNYETYFNENWDTCSTPTNVSHISSWPSLDDVTIIALPKYN